MSVVAVVILGLAVFIAIADQSTYVSQPPSVIEGTATVTEEIIQESINSLEGCTERMQVTNSTVFFTPTYLMSLSTTVTTTEISHSTTTITISPPSYMTTVENGTTVVRAC